MDGYEDDRDRRGQRDEGDDGDRDDDDDLVLFSLLCENKHEPRLTSTGNTHTGNDDKT